VLAHHRPQRGQLSAQPLPLRALEPCAHHEARRDQQFGIEAAQSLEGARRIVDAIEHEQLAAQRPQIVA
jgi:hypothetical protein